MMRRHYSTAGGPISMKVGRLTHNNVPIMVDHMVEIETGSRIPIWRALIFFKPEIGISQS